MPAAKDGCDVHLQSRNESVDDAAAMLGRTAEKGSRLPAAKAGCDVHLQSRSESVNDAAAMLGRTAEKEADCLQFKTAAMRVCKTGMKALIRLQHCSAVEL